MTRIFWDTNLFVYFFQDYGEESRRIHALRKRMIERGDELVTSTLTVAELMVKPERERRPDISNAYEKTLRESATIVPFDLRSARNYARIRSNPTRKIAPADAIQLACAATAQVDLFLTNDAQLDGFRIEGIHFVTTLKKAPL